MSLKIQNQERFLMRSVIIILLKLSAGLLLILICAIIFGFWLEDSHRQKDAESLTPPGQFIRIGERQVHCHCQGEGVPTVWLESGGQGWSSSWVRVQRALSSFTTVCAYDRAGLGFSDAMEGTIDGTVFAKDLNQLRKLMGDHEPMILVGHSLGGMLARIYYDQYPEDVTGLFLIEPGDPGEVVKMMEELPEIKPVYVQLARFAANVGLVRWVYQDKLLDPLYPKEFVTDFKARFSTPDVVGAFVNTMRALKQIAVQAGDSDLINEISIRVLYTTNFSEVGTSFENNEEKEAFESAYLEHWTSLAEQGIDPQRPIVIDDANHLTVTLYPHYAKQVSAHIIDLVELVRVQQRRKEEDLTR